MVDNGERANTSQDEVLGYFIRESFHRDEEDVGGSDPENGLDYVLRHGLLLTFPVLAHPRVGFVGHTTRFHLGTSVRAVRDVDHGTYRR